MSRTLDHYQDFFLALRQSLAEKFELQCEVPLATILKNPRLIVCMNHSTPLSWIPGMVFLSTEVVNAGGGHRQPRGVVDKWFYTNPLTRFVAERLTQSKTPENFDQLVQHFTNAQNTDLIVLPEGAHSFFGSPEEIQDFRSSRFIELSILTQTPILLCVHRGSENWSSGLKIPASASLYIAAISQFFAGQIEKEKPLQVPVLPKKMELFSMSLKLYSPQLYQSDLASSKSERKNQLEAESEVIKEIMQEMFEALPVA